MTYLSITTQLNQDSDLETLHDYIHPTQYNLINLPSFCSNNELNAPFFE